MYTWQERAQLRAALQLWLVAVRTSKTHPSELPACKVELITAGCQPLSETRIEAMIEALTNEIVYTTVTLAAERYGVSRLALKRQLVQNNVVPVPGSKVYSRADIVYAVNVIRKRKDRGFFG